MPNKFFLILSLALSLYSVHLHAYGSESLPQAQSGVIDLRQWDFDQNGSLPLEGEWAFYWQRFYSMAELLELKPEPDAFYPVPRRWGNFVLDNGERVPPKGYATLQLKILMPKATPGQHLRLFLGSSDASFKLEAFDKQGKALATTLKGGDVGISREQYRPLWVRDSAPIEHAGEIHLLWHISNFDMKFDGGGPKKPPLLGYDKDITLNQENQRSFNAITTGILLIMAIYHLVLFALRQEDKAPLWFGFSCLFIALFSVLAPHYIEQNFPKTDSFELLTKLLLLSGTLPLAFNVLFVRSLIPEHSGRYLWRMIIFLCALYCLLLILVPLRIYDNFRATMLLLGALSSLWYVQVFYKAIFQDRNFIALLLAIGFSIFGVASLSDILVANALLSLPYMASYGLSAFVLFQSVVIAIQNQQAHQEKFQAQKQAAESNRKALETEQLALQEQKSLTQSFERFVPADFLKLLNKQGIQDVELGNFTKREMSVLFSDIRSFTTLSESMSPEDNFRFLNSYLKRMEPVIHKNGGVIDKYIGDAIMAIFPGSADNAIQAAIEMLDALAEYNQHRDNSTYSPISIGIGINTGELMLGTIGGTDRMEGTVISDAVNLASRLEGLTKMYGASIAISSDTLEKTSLEKFQTRILDTVVVKGRSEPVTIYEVLNSEPPESRQQKLDSNEFLLKAIQQRREGQLEQCKQTLLIGKSLFPEDLAIKRHLDDIEKLILLGLPENWQGATILDSK